MSGRAIIVTAVIIGAGIAGGGYLVYRGARSSVHAEMRTLVADLQKFVDDERDRL